MSMRAFITAAFLLVALSTVSAEPLPVYFGTYTQGENSSKGIYRSELDLETGKLSAAVLAAKAQNPSFLEIHPNGKFLYAVSEYGGDGSVSAYAIDTDKGDLKFLNQRPSGGAGPCHVNIDYAGKNLLIANYGSGSASVIPIKPDGKLGEPTGFAQHEGSSVNTRRQEGPHAHSVNVSPDNRFAFVADLGIDKIMIYRLDVEKGTIVANSPPFAKVKPGAGPRHFAFHPNGKYAYVINELDCTVTAFAYEPASGALTEIQTVTTLPERFGGTNTCAEVRVHPSGKFLYGSNRGHDSIVVYRVDLSNGTLTLVEHENSDIKTPRNFNIDPTGKFCLVANQDKDSVVVFQVSQETGELEPTGHKISIAKPVCVRFLRPNCDVSVRILVASEIVQAAPPVVTNASSLEGVKENNKSKAVDTNNRLGDMVTIPAGSFLMGNNGHEGFGGPEEFPQHSVNLSTYQIGKYEVTRGQYRKFIEAGGYQNPSYWSPQGWKWKESDVIDYAGMHGNVTHTVRPNSRDKRNEPEHWAAEQEWIGHGFGHPRFIQTDNHPVVGVTYYEAEAYCKWAGGRLPTEAEWEKAARWDEKNQHANTWPWGDTWDPEKCNNPEDHNLAAGGYRVNQSAPVGSYPTGASPYGCMDMVGNAWEWVASRSKSHPGNPEPFDHTDAYRLVKGGCWDDGPSVVRCSSRIWYLPPSSSGTGPGDSDYIGFRVARLAIKMKGR